MDDSGEIRMTSPPGGTAAPPPPPLPPYPVAAPWGRMREEMNLTFALGMGLLGGLFVIISSFVGWIKQEDYYARYFEDVVRSSSTFSALILILGLALWVGVLMAYIWHERLAGGIFCLIIASAFSFAGFIMTIAQVSMAGTGEPGFVGAGAYLGLIGALLSLLSALLFLASRKAKENR